MSYDLYLTLGAVILVFAIPAVVAAFADSRAPRVAVVMVVIGGAMVAWAVTQNPAGYSFTEIPRVFVEVIGQILR